MVLEMVERVVDHRAPSGQPSTLGVAEVPQARPENNERSRSRGYS